MTRDQASQPFGTVHLSDPEIFPKNRSHFSPQGGGLPGIRFRGSNGGHGATGEIPAGSEPRMQEQFNEGSGAAQNEVWQKNGNLDMEEFANCSAARVAADECTFIMTRAEADIQQIVDLPVIDKF